MTGALQTVFQNQRSFVTVPDAPTINTATQTGATTATISYTAPASNGGATITSYTATSSPGGVTGTLNQAGSGTITVSGLTTNTTYTFTVKATNSIGQSAASAASNSITPIAPSFLISITSPTNRQGLCVASDSLNNIIVSDGTSITKLDSSGVLLWSYINASITVMSMVVDSSNNIYVAGVASGVGGFIAKFNSSGTVVWQRSQNAGMGQGGFYQRDLTWYTIRLDSSENIYLGGTYYDNNRQSYCCCGTNRYYSNRFGYMATAKYNSSGTLQWARKFGSTTTSGINLASLPAIGCAVDASGNVIVSGTAQINSGGNSGVAVLKYNSSGTQQWGYTYKDNSSGGYAEGIVDCDSSDNIYITSGPGGGTPRFLKVNSSGTFQWGRSISGTGSIRLRSMYIDRTNSLLYIAGGWSLGIPQYNDALLTKFNTDGALQFGRTLGYQSGESYEEYINGITISSDNKMVFSGRGNTNQYNNMANVLGRTPIDGSKTGTYSGYGGSQITYQSVSPTIYSQTYTTYLATVVYGPSSGGVADSAFSYTDAATAYSYTTQSISYTTTVL